MNTFLSSFDDGAERQRGLIFCPVSFSTAKKVRLNIWGNTEKQDAPYDIAEVKLIRLDPGPCRRNFVVKKCQTGSAQNPLWLDCPDAALDSSYQQCCSPLLAINSTISDDGQYTDKGDWHIGMVPDSQSWSTLGIGCAYDEGPIETYSIHPNLTPECPKPAVLGLGQEVGEDVLGTCDIEITKFRRCPEEDRPDGNPDDGVTRSEPLVEFYRKGAVTPMPNQTDYPNHKYRVCSKTLVWDIFYVDDVLEFSSVDDFPATPAVSAFYVAAGKVYRKKESYTPQGQYPVEQQYVLIDDYYPGAIKWYAAVAVIGVPAQGPTLDAEQMPPGFPFIPIPGVGAAFLYYAPLECGINGKPKGKIPEPPELPTLELYDGTDVSDEFVFPTMTLYAPGTGVPTNDNEKPPVITLAPEWCGVQQCKNANCDCDNPRPFAAIGQECNCNKGCLVNNVIARVGIAGSDENIPCETADHFMCRTFEVPAGDYYVAMSTDTVDQLHHTNMQHHFLFDWCDVDDDTLICADGCAGTGNSSSSSSTSSSSVANSSSSGSDICVNPILYLEMNMEGANGATNFVDTSPNNLTLIPTNVTMTTAYKYSGNTSAQLNGISGDPEESYISVSNADLSKFNQIFNNPYAPFKIEAWVYPTTLPENSLDPVLSIASDWAVIPSRWGFRLRTQMIPVISNNVQLSFEWTAGNVQNSVQSTSYANLNEWNYVAVTRAADGKFTINLNGDITAADDYVTVLSAHNSGSFRVGGGVGYIDNFKFLGCGTDSSNSSSSNSSSSSSSPTAQNLFDATSWAAVEEPYKTYLTNADARWSAKLAFTPARYAAIREYYGGAWAGVTLNALIKINDPATNMIASCQLVDAVSFGTGGPDTYAPTYFNMTVNEAFTGSPEFDATFWETVVAHELGHALGIGTLWTSANNALNGAAYDNAQAAYNNITGLSRQYTPLEADGGAGTAGAHWENAYRASPNNPGLPAGLNTDFNGVQNELMIGAITADPGNMVMSQLTIGALVDIGFVAIGVPENNPITIGGAQLITSPPRKFCGHDPTQTPTITVLPNPSTEQ